MLMVLVVPVELVVPIVSVELVVLVVLVVRVVLIVRVVCESVAPPTTRLLKGICRRCIKVIKGTEQ